MGGGPGPPYRPLLNSDNGNQPAMSSGRHGGGPLGAPFFGGVPGGVPGPPYSPWGGRPPRLSLTHWAPCAPPAGASPPVGSQTRVQRPGKGLQPVPRGGVLGGPGRADPPWSPEAPEPLLSQGQTRQKGGPDYSRGPQAVRPRVFFHWETPKNHPSAEVAPLGSVRALGPPRVSPNWGCSNNFFY